MVIPESRMYKTGRTRRARFFRGQRDMAAPPDRRFQTGPRASPDGRRWGMKFSVLSFLKRKKGPSRNELMRGFKVKYDNFKLLLESNTELLKIISDIEQKLRGRSGFGLPYIEAQTMRAFFHCSRMIH